jgi:membrane protein
VAKCEKPPRGSDVACGTRRAGPHLQTCNRAPHEREIASRARGSLDGRGQAHVSKLAEAHGNTADRGRDAVDVGDIPASGWKDVLFRVKRRIADDNLSITAAGVAFYALLATFPGLLALFGIYGLVFDPGQLADQLGFLQGQLEPEAMNLLVFLISGLSGSGRAGAGFGIAGGALVTLWGASLGVRALIRTLNLAYAETEKRSLFQRHAVALLLTVGAICVAFCIGVALMGVPITRGLHPAPALQRFAFYARWPVVAVMFWLSLLVFYRYGPSRVQPRWSWVSWGALLATASWLCGTGVLAWYVAGSRQYHLAYGSVGIVVLVLAWFLLSAFSVLLGAEVNAELERQTREDTTVGPAKPVGTRGASAADTLGDAVL